MNMGKHTLYNVVFPIFLMIFLPPIILVVMVLNYIIDRVVIVFGAKHVGADFKEGSKHKIILSAWLFGFFADIVAACAIYLLGDLLTQNLNLFTFSEYMIWDSAGTVFVFLVGIMLAGYLILVFNQWLFVKYGIDKQKAKKMAWYMAIITAPWLMLLPTPMGLL